MKNIFDLTKREQRLVIVIVVALVAVAFAKHLSDTRTRPESARPARSTSPAKTSPTILAEEEKPEPDDSR
ncbi:MAG: hypothetical protein QOE81_2286 [Verrucomicrobiota bacterium]|jgi:hypothetical protein